MARQTEGRMLDSKEACEELRERYFDSAFKTAYSITGSYSEADALARRLFENMEARFHSEPLPSVLELYILSQINLLYAKGDVQYKRTPSATAPPSKPAPTPEASPRPPEEPQPDVKEPTPERPAEAPKAAAPTPPAPEPGSGGRSEEQYDHRLTELWIPGSEQERQNEPAQASSPEMEETAPVDTAAAAQTDNERSVPLTIANTVLFLVLLGSAAFALAEMGLFKLLI